MDDLFKFNEKIINKKQSKNDYKKAGVVAIIYPEKQEEHLLIIKRNEYPGHHSGQLALPGGKLEEGDLNIRHAAKREVFEEIGVDLEPEKLVFFHEQWVEVSQFIITCFFVKLNQKPIFKLDEKEVNCIFEIPVRELKNSDNHYLQELSYQGRKFKSPYFLINNQKIWGATAMILIKLFDLNQKFKQ